MRVTRDSGYVNVCSNIWGVPAAEEEEVALAAKKMKEPVWKTNITATEGLTLIYQA
jgi:hypothetical protein